MLTVSLRLAASCQIQQCTPVCLVGGKGKSANDNEAWKSLEKAMGSLKKEQSLEDVLRQQMEKQEYYDDGGSGGKCPGGGTSGGNGSGGSEDEGLSGMLDEVLQVFLATLGIIFLYIYIIAGEEVFVFAKGVTKFLFAKRLSPFVFYPWGRFYQNLNTKTEIEPY